MGGTAGPCRRGGRGADQWHRGRGVRGAADHHDAGDQRRFVVVKYSHAIMGPNPDPSLGIFRDAGEKGLIDRDYCELAVQIPIKTKRSADPQVPLFGLTQ